jgi:hypothetical protein
LRVLTLAINRHNSDAEGEEAGGEELEQGAGG